MSLFDLCLLLTVTSFTFYLGGPAVARWLTPRRLAWLLITATTGVGLLVVTVLTLAMVRYHPAYSGPWQGMHNGQMSYCTVTVHPDGSASYTGCHA